MPLIRPTVSREISPCGSVLAVTWPVFTEADTWQAVQLPAWAERTFQVTGTFNGGTLQILGSNDNVNFSVIGNRQGAALAFTSTGINSTNDQPIWVRPFISAGAGMSLTVTMAAYRYTASATSG